MAFEELDARVIGSGISIRLDGLAPGVSPEIPVEPMTPRPTAAPVNETPTPTMETATNRAEPARPASRASVEALTQRAPDRVSMVPPEKKSRGLFIMKPLNAERLRTAWAAGAIVFVALVAGDIAVHGGWGFLQGMLPTPHVPSKPVVNAVVQPTVAAAHPAQPVASSVAVVVPGASTPVASVQTPAPEPKPQPIAPQAAAPTPAPAAPVASVPVQPQPVKTVIVEPVPSTVLANTTPVPPLPMSPLPVHHRTRAETRPENPPRREVRQPTQSERVPSQSEQNSPILVGGQYSNKAMDSRGSDSK